MKNQQDNLQEIANQVSSALPKMNDQQRHISLQIYRLLAKGNPVAVNQLTSSLGLSEDFVRTTLKEWPAVFYDEKGLIVGYWGLSLSKMKHLFIVDDKELYTWCAWDTLFIPQIIKKKAEVKSECPVTHEEIQLTVTPSGVDKTSDSNVYVSFLIPDKIDDSIITKFCHYIYFFKSLDAAKSWTLKNEGTFVLPLNDAYLIAKKKNSIQYGNLLL